MIILQLSAHCFDFMIYDFTDGWWLFWGTYCLISVQPETADSKLLFYLTVKKSECEGFSRILLSGSRLQPTEYFETYPVFGLSTLGYSRNSVLR